MAGEDSGDDVRRPPLQELVACGVRGVREGLTRNQPCLMKGQTLLINKDAHQFDNSYGRMSIVKLYGNLISEQIKLLIMCLLEASDYILDASSTEEVLLLDYVSLYLLGCHGVLVE